MIARKQPRQRRHLSQSFLEREKKGRVVVQLDPIEKASVDWLSRQDPQRLRDDLPHVARPFVGVAARNIVAELSGDGRRMLADWFRQTFPERCSPQG